MFALGARPSGLEVPEAPADPAAPAADTGHGMGRPVILFSEGELIPLYC